MKKKWLLGILGGLCVLSCAMGLTACRKDKEADVKSPYEIWLEIGYTGTEADFIAWLSGQDGDDTNPAYKLWLDLGYTGTEEDFIAWLTTQDVSDRNLAYERWKEAGFTGTEEDFIAWLIVTVGKQEGTAGLQYQRISGKAEYRVMGVGVAADLDIVIPSTYNNLPVTEINANAFKDQEYIESVTIPEGVKTIGASAFEDCDNLEKVIIADSVTTIGEKAFGWCEKMTEVTIGSGVTVMGAHAFRDCVLLGKVSYTGTAASWAQITFSDVQETNPLYYAKGLYIKDKLLTEADLTTVKTISEYAFYNCEGLTEVILSSETTSIGEKAFFGCTDINKVNYLGTANSWAKINFADYYANPIFYSKNLYINDQVLTKAEITTTEVKENAFIGCDTLMEVILSNSVTAVGGNSFYKCNKLKTMTIGDGVQTIGKNAFFECEALESIAISGNWYRVDVKTNWENKTGGTLTDLSEAVMALCETYAACYWYKL